MYTYISDLPPQVREVLSITRQEEWLAAFQESYRLDPNFGASYQTAWKKVLADTYPGEVIGSDTPDLGGDPQSITPSTDGKTVNITINASEPRHFLRPIDPKSFSEGNTSWVQAIPIGTWMHPLYGPIDITPDRVKQFATNVNNNVRGQQLDIDYEHKDSVQGGKAAGWVMQAQARDDGLWLQVQWTPSAAKALKEGEYKYFSPEFTEEWQDPATSLVYHDVLFGGALTNRPFLKGILPINLSETFNFKFDQTPMPTTYTQDEANYRPATDDNVRCADCQYMQGTNGCSLVQGFVDPAGVCDYFAPQGTAVFSSNVAHTLNTTGNWVFTTVDTTNQIQWQWQWQPTITFTPPRKEVDTLLKQLSELLGVKEEEATVLEAVKALTAKNVEDEKAKKFAEMFPEEAKQMAEQAKQLQETAVEKRLSEWAKAGIAPKVLEETVKPYRLSLTGEAAEKFDAVMATIAAEDKVKFEEVGSSTTRDDSDPETFISEVKKFQEEHKADYRTAIREVTKLQPQLAESYNRSIKNRKEVSN